MEDKEFKEHIKEMARLELKNSFTDNLMQTLNSSFIFKYVQTLEEENQQLKDKLKKIEELFENTIENNKYSYLSKLRDEQCFAIGNNEICRKGLSIIKGE